MIQDPQVGDVVYLSDPADLTYNKWLGSGRWVITAIDSVCTWNAGYTTVSVMTVGVNEKGKHPKGYSGIRCRYLSRDEFLTATYAAANKHAITFSQKKREAKLNAKKKRSAA